MDTVSIPVCGSPRPLTFYLALEEWLARKYEERDFFFPWQVTPTVIIGRHQLLEHEVDIDFCRRHGIEIVRRKSGGGAVLADMNNIMFSYVTSSDSVVTTFSRYTSMIADALRALGLDASDNSRNDILIGDRKVSGNSFYHIPGRSIVHGTMLYDFDRQLMAGALTPPVSKLESHGVKSVRSRVTTIREHLPNVDIDSFRTHVTSFLVDGETLSLSPADILEVEQLAAAYSAPGWLEGKSPKGILVNTERIEGVGTLTVHLAVAGGNVSDFSLSGDYLALTDDISEIIASRLRGVPYRRDTIGRALDGTEKLIPGLKKNKIAELIC